MAVEQDLELADSFGVVQRSLASFKDGSFGWLGWSPDGTRASPLCTRLTMNRWQQMSMCSTWRTVS